MEKWLSSRYTQSCVYQLFPQISLVPQLSRESTPSKCPEEIMEQSFQSKVIKIHKFNCTRNMAYPFSTSTRALTQPSMQMLHLTLKLGTKDLVMLIKRPFKTWWTKSQDFTFTVPTLTTVRTAKF